jgi:Tfp pilus assembly protein PilE
MKNEKGIALIGLVIVVLLTAVALFAGTNYLKEYVNNQKNEDIKANMLAIQTVITNVKNKHTVDETNNILVGTKLDLENNETGYTISDEFKNVLLSLENAELYILNTEELNNLGVKNIEVNNTAFYVVDYNSEEILYSLGVNGVYKLSEM